MSKPRCGVCDREEWPEKLLYCEADEMWLCSHCCYHLGLQDITPRCPRCFSLLAPSSPPRSPTFASTKAALRGRLKGGNS